MNMIATIEVLPPAVAPTIEEWLEIGRTIVDEGRRVGWAFADWARQGESLGYTKQLGFDFLAGQLGISPQRLKVVFKAATVPAPCRDTTLGIEHHAHVADLPNDEQMDLLGQASEHRWNDEDLRKQVISHKVSRGHTHMLDQQEWDEYCAMQLRHWWNKGSGDVRSDFLEMATDAKGGVIDG